MRLSTLLTIAILCLFSVGANPNSITVDTTYVREILKTLEADNSEEMALLLLKRWEGFLPSSKWDVTAYRNGWSTPAPKGEKISIEEADKRALEFFRRIRKNTQKKYPGLDAWELNILTVTIYNVGSFGPRMEKAIHSGDREKMARAMQVYVRSNGAVLGGLVNRRAEEAELLLSTKDTRLELVESLRKIVDQHTSGVST